MEVGSGIAELAAARGLALTRFAYALCGDLHLAEDLVQQALTDVHRRWRATSGPDHPEAYVRQAIVHAFVTSRRRRSSRELVTSDPPVIEIDTATTADVVARDPMWRVLASLPARQRAVLVLRYYEDLDDHAIARVLGCAEGTVRSAASRAFETLRADPVLAEERRT